MSTLQELREKRANIWSQAQEFNERHKAGDAMSAEDEAAWTRALDEIDQLGTQIETRERTEALDKRFGEIDEEQASRSITPGGDTPSVDQYRDAFHGYLRHGLSGVDAEARALLEANFRAQGTSPGSAGGFTVPEGFWAKVTETLKWYAQVAQVAEVIDTETGNKLPWPTLNDTANKGRLLDENTQVTEEAITFGQAQLDAFTFTSDLILISLQLLQDTGVDIEGKIAAAIGTRIGRIVNEYYTTGTGTSQPQGYVTGATTGKTTAGSTAIVYDEIIDLIHSVDPAYRQNGRFAFHDSILAYVRKIRDDSGGAGLGRPIWEPSIQAGVPDQIFGYGYFVNNFMDDSIAASKKTMAFGDFRSAFVVRNVRGMQLMRLAERYADYLQVGFFGFSRSDSVVQDASAVKLLVQKT